MLGEICEFCIVKQSCQSKNVALAQRKAHVEKYIYALYTSALHVFMYRRSFFMWYNPKTPKTDITHRLDKVHIVSSKQGQNRLLNGCVHYGLIFNSERTSFGSFKEKNNENYKWEKG